MTLWGLSHGRTIKSGDLSTIEGHWPNKNSRRACENYLAIWKMFIAKLWKSSWIPLQLIQRLLWVDEVEPWWLPVWCPALSCNPRRASSPAPVTSRGSVSVPPLWNDRECPHALARYCAFVIIGEHQKGSRDVAFDSQQPDGSGVAPLTMQKRWEEEHDKIVVTQSDAKQEKVWAASGSPVSQRETLLLGHVERGAGKHFFDSPAFSRWSPRFYH